MTLLILKTCPMIRKPRKKTEHPESRLQRSCVKWFRLQYPRVLLFAIPNGGDRSPVEAAIMQGEGVERGIPDLCLPRPKASWHGLYLEAKIAPNDLSPDQVEKIDFLRAEGYRCEVFYTLDQFMSIVNNYLKLPDYGSTTDENR